MNICIYHGNTPLKSAGFKRGVLGRIVKARVFTPKGIENAIKAELGTSGELSINSDLTDGNVDDIKRNLSDVYNEITNDLSYVDGIDPTVRLTDVALTGLYNSVVIKQKAKAARPITAKSLKISPPKVFKHTEAAGEVNAFEALNTLSPNEYHTSGTLLQNYFDGLDLLVDDFQSYVKQTVDKAFIDLRSDTVIGSIGDAVAKAREAVGNKKGPKKQYTKNGILNSASDGIKEAYYNEILNKHFDNIIIEFLPGFTLHNGRAVFRDTSGIKTSNLGTDGGVDQTNQKSTLFDYHFSTIPRVVIDSNNKVSRVNVSSTEGRFLSKAEIGSIMGKVKYNPDPEKFGESLRLFATRKTATKTEHVAASSIYKKFFAPSKGKVGNTVTHSFTSSKHKKLNDIAGRVHTYLMSTSKSSYWSYVNGGVVNKRGAGIAGDVNTFITGFNEEVRTEVGGPLKSKYQVSVVVNEDNNNIDNKVVTLKIGGSSGFEIQLNSKDNQVGGKKNKGVIVKLASKLTPRVNHLSILGFPRAFDDDFINYYSANQGNVLAKYSTEVDNIIGLDGMMANMMYLMAMNNPINREELNKLGMGLPANVDIGMFENVDVFENLPTFKAMMGTFLADLNTRDEKTMILNTAGDNVAKYNPATMFDKISSLVEDIAVIEASVDQETPYHGQNALVTGVMNITGITNKDSYVNGLRSKKGVHLETKESMTMLIDGSVDFLGKTSFKTTIYQPSSAADRGKVPNFEVSKPTGYMNSVGAIASKSSLIHSEIAKQKGRTRIILTNWSKAIADITDDADIIAKFSIATEEGDGLLIGDPLIKSLESLNSHISHLPAELAEKVWSSSHLMAGVDYRSNKLGSRLEISPTALYWESLTNNPKLLGEYYEKSFLKFKQDLKDVGYTPTNRSVGITRARLGITDPASVTRAILRNYYFNQVMFSGSVQDITGSSALNFPDKNLIPLSDRDVEEITLDNTDKDGVVDIKKVTSEIQYLEFGKSMSDMYSAQSKRNSILTSGHQSLSQVAADKEGFEIGESFNQVLIRDIELQVDLITSLGFKNIQDVTDAAVMALPLYEMRVRESLGQETADLVGEGSAIKDITTGISKHGVGSTMDKKATFNPWSGSQVMNLSKESLQLAENMMSTIPWGKGKNGVLIDMNTGKIVTDPTLDTKEFKNMLDLFRHFGGWESVYSAQPGSYGAFESMAPILSKNPAIREKYIEKAGFPTGQKLGNSGLNTYEHATGRDSKVSYQTISNFGHGIILNPDHDPDTTVGKPKKSMMTQPITVAAFEGDTHGITQQLYDAIGNLTAAGIRSIKSDLEFASIQSLEGKLLEGITNNDPIDTHDVTAIYKAIADYQLTGVMEGPLQGFIDKYNAGEGAIKIFAKNLANQALAKRDVTSTLMVEILKNNTDVLDSPTISKTVYSAILSEVDARSTSIKFTGEEYVVATTGNSMLMYDNGKGVYVSRADAMESEHIPEVLLTTVQEIKELHPIDIVNYDGESLHIGDLYAKGLSDETLIENGITVNRLNDTDKDMEGLKKARNLQWASHYFLDEDGEPSLLEDTDEYLLLVKNGLAIQKAQKDDDIELFKTLETARIQLEKDFKFMLDDDTKGWIASDAEFLMPMMHASAYKLTDPLTGKPDISVILGDIMIDPVKGEDAMHVRNGKVLHNYREGDKFDYTLTRAQIEHMTEFFEERLLRHSAFDGVIYQHFIDGTLNEYRSSLHEQYEGDTLGKEDTKELTELITFLDSIHELDESAQEKAINKRLQSASTEEGRLSEARTMALSFPKTLTFFAARVPSQAKQSGVVGKVKGFVSTQRNTAFGPYAMLKVTGADHDVDKTSVLTYSVDSRGIIYDYVDYLSEDGNTIDPAKVEEARVGYINTYVSDRNDSFERHVISEKAKDSGFDENAARVKHINGVTKVLSRKNKEFSNDFIKAIKNRVLDGLVDTWRAPENAIEAATAITMETLEAAKKDMEAIAYEEGEITKLPGKGGYVLKSGNFFSKDTPTSMAILEKQNAVGSTAIGIAASGTKSYGAIFYSAMQDPDNINIQYSNEYGRSSEVTKVLGGVKAVEGKKGVEAVEGVEAHIAEYNRKSITTGIVNSDGTITLFNTDSIANTKKFKESAMIYTEEDVDGVLTKILDKYATKNNQYLIALDDHQGWESISQILSASTDNAKELILTKLNISQDTMPMVLNGIMLGVKLEVLLSALNSPAVKATIKSYIDKSDLTAHVDNDRIERLNEIIIAKARAITAEAESALGSEKDNEKRVEIVKSLLSNPIVVYAKVAKSLDELSAISGMLSLNTNMVNSLEDHILFFNKFNKRMSNHAAKFMEAGRPVMNDVTKVMSKGKPRDLKAFMLALKYDNEAAMRVIKDYDDKHKTHYNPYYIIATNPYYAGFMDAVILGDELSAMSTIIPNVTHKLLESIEYKKITEDTVNGVSKFANKLIINKFLTDNKTKVTFRGEVYELDNLNSQGKFLREFVKETSALKGNRAIANNMFIQNLSIDQTKPDANGNTWSFVKPSKNSDLGPILKESAIIGLNKLHSEDKDYVDALFYYDLILNNSSLGDKAFSTFFDPRVIESAGKFHLKFFTRAREIRESVMDEVAAMAPSDIKLSVEDLIETKWLYEKNSQQSMEDIRLQEEADAEAMTRDSDGGIASSYIYYDRTKSINDGAMDISNYSPDIDEHVFKASNSNLMWGVYGNTPARISLRTGVSPLGLNITTRSGLPNPLDILEGTPYDWGMEAKYAGSEVRVLRFNPSKGLYEGLIEGVVQDLSTEVLLNSNPKHTYRGHNFGVTHGVDSRNRQFRRGIASLTNTDFIHSSDKNRVMSPQLQGRSGILGELIQNKEIKFHDLGVSMGTLADGVKRSRKVDKVMRTIKSSDTVVFLNDVVDYDKVEAAFTKAQRKVDIAVIAGATIRIDSKQGLDSEIISYVINSNPSYVYDSNSMTLSLDNKHNDIIYENIKLKSGNIPSFNPNLHHYMSVVEGETGGTSYRLSGSPTDWNGNAESSTALSIIGMGATYAGIEPDVDYKYEIISKAKKQAHAFLTKVAEVHGVAAKPLALAISRFDSSEFEMLTYMIHPSMRAGMIGNLLGVQLDPTMYRTEAAMESAPLNDGTKNIISNLDMFAYNVSTLYFFARGQEITRLTAQGRLSKADIMEYSRRSAFSTIGNAYPLVYNMGGKATKHVLNPKKLTLIADIQNPGSKINKAKGSTIDAQITGKNVHNTNYKGNILENVQINGVSSKKPYTRGTVPKVKHSKTGIIDTHGVMKASKAVSLPVIKEVVGIMSEGLDVEVRYETTATIVEEFGESFRDSRGFEIDGVVVINKDNVRLDTPIHEFGHVYLAQLKLTDPKLYEAIVSRSLQDPIMADIKSRYPHLSDTELGEEVFVTLLGLDSQVTATKAVEQSKKGFMKWLKGILNNLFGKSGVNKLGDIDVNTSLKEMIEIIGDDMLNDKSSALSNLTEQNKNSIKKITQPKVGFKDILSKLEALGFIQKTC